MSFPGPESRLKCCVGFCFLNTDEKQEVILVKKSRPKWQKGKLNGVGGAIEEMESPQVAMYREFLEETGIETSLDDWKEIATITEPNGVTIYIFAMVTKSRVDLSKVTDEEISYFDIYEVLTDKYELVHDIKWLIPLAQQLVSHPYILTAKLESLTQYTKE